MLQRLRALIMNHLGFNVKEANGTLVLILLLCAFIFGPVLFNEFIEDQSSSFESDREDILAWKKEFEVKKIEPDDKKNLSKSPLTAFDPNEISKEQWISMGIKPSVAGRIINYRKAGGSFSSKNDLYKIYGMDSTILQDLLPYVEIQQAELTAVKEKTRLPESPLPASPSERIELIPINQASPEELRTIYGIGERLAQRIIRYRMALGGYHSLDQLTEVYFFQDSLLPKVAAKFSFDDPELVLIDINADSLSLLKSHPYLNYNQAKAIISYRNVHGPFANPADMGAIKIIPDSTIEKLKPYLSVKD